jgi:GNAT superfamily N-acetyltransferase
MAEIEQLIGVAAIEIRVVSPKSAAVWRCLAAYFRKLAARFESGFNPGGGDPASEEEMTPPNGFFVLGRLDGRAVGCGGLRRIDEPVGEIKRMWTAPRARGQGVARRVLHELEVLARGAGIETLRLHTNRVLVEAQAMYRREGYRKIARYNDNPYAHHWFEKKLEPTAWPGRQLRGALAKGDLV